MEELINQYILGNAFDYFPKLKDKSVDLFFSGIPDINELDKINIEEYKNFIEKSLKEIARIIKDDGFVVLCQTDRKINGTILLKHLIIANEMLKLGFVVKDYKILIKDNIDKINLYRLNYSHILIFTKNGKIKAEKRNKEYLKDLWIFKTPTNKNFFNEDFCNLIIKTFSNENNLVVDMFAGRGTVLKIAKKLNRKYFGTEIKSDVYNKNYFYN
jgi:DNA modification methylase